MKLAVLALSLFFLVGFVCWHLLTRNAPSLSSSMIIMAPTTTVASTSSTTSLMPPPAMAAESGSKKEAIGPLIKVVTLYQKGEGESDLAAYASRGMAYELKREAIFSQVNTLDEPQAAVFYGVIEHPTVVFLSASGKVLSKHQGYLEKAEVVALLKKFKAR